MDSAERQLIRQTFARLEPMAGLTALLFYQHLFTVAPQVQQMFSSDIEEQGAKLMGMLRTIVDCLEHPHAMEPALREMGQRHAGYGVQEAHYDIVGPAMLNAFGDVLGAEFTPAARTAWAKAYQWIADTMKTGAATPHIDQPSILNHPHHP